MCICCAPLCTVVEIPVPVLAAVEYQHLRLEAVVSNGDPDGAWHLIQELGEA